MPTDISAWLLVSVGRARAESGALFSSPQPSDIRRPIPPLSPPGGRSSRSAPRGLLRASGEDTVGQSPPPTSRAIGNPPRSSPRVCVDAVGVARARPPASQCADKPIPLAWRKNRSLHGGCQPAAGTPSTGFVNLTRACPTALIKDDVAGDEIKFIRTVA